MTDDLDVAQLLAAHPQLRADLAEMAAAGEVLDRKEVLRLVNLSLRTRSSPLAILLRQIDDLDQADPVDYTTRNYLTLFAIGAAVAENIPVGIGADEREPSWPVVYFELPTGQVSWHLPQHDRPYDGHDAAAKSARIRAFGGRSMRPGQ